MSHPLFGLVDYIVFGVVLVVTASIGIFYAWRGAGRSTADYLTAKQQLGIFPVSMSVAAGFLAATALLATPTDIYLTGTMHWWIVLPMFLILPVIGTLYLPVFYELQVVSSNQYLEMRFNHIIRRFASALFIVNQWLGLAIVVYGPSLALNQMTGTSVYCWVGIAFGICLFYTFIGGIKAVIWTDTLQIFLVLGSIFTVLIKGILDAGGIDVIWQRSLNSSRIEFFNIDADLTTRHTIWSTVIGGLFFWANLLGVNQMAVQRYLVMPSISKARIVMVINSCAMGSIISLCCLFGLVIYARYYDCDPVSANMVNKPDQIVPFFVMDIVGNLPGLPGLFVAGVFSGALSSLSSGLNSVALVVLEDFIRPFKPDLADQSAVKIAKCLSLLVGCVCFASIFLIAGVQTLLDATLSLTGAYGGAILGTFTLGMLVPWANSIGAGAGMVTSFALMMALGLASQAAKSGGFMHNQMKSFRTDGCPAPTESNITLLPAALLLDDAGLLASENESRSDGQDIFVLLKVSYLWYTVMGFTITLVVGSLTSLLTRCCDSAPVNPKLLFPFIRKRFGSKQESSEILTATQQASR